MQFHLSKFISFSILLITVSSINQWTSLPIGNTFLWWGIYISILWAFLKARKGYYDKNNNQLITVVSLYLFWNIFCIIRGFFVAENYWEWKNLVGTAMIFLLPVSVYITTNRDIMQKLLGTWIKYALPAFFLFIPFFVSNDALGQYLVPISFLLLFFPLLSKKWKVVILFFTFFVVVGALDARSNVIKFSVAFVFGMLFYSRELIPKGTYNCVRLLFLAIPIILFISAVTGGVNVFKMDEYINGDYTTTVVENGEVKEESLTTDTRTLLYEEVLFSALKNNYILFGRTPARGNDSELFGLYLAEELNTGKMERFNNEVSILNIFTWTGLIGVFLYFLIFYRASFLAIKRSNNTVIKIIGMYVTFRWAYAWVEDFSRFDLSYFFLWALIGMCFSRSFRQMNDLEMKLWVRGIFDVRYRKMQLTLNLLMKNYFKKQFLTENVLPK